MEECTICMEELSQPNRELCCGHVFHDECIDTWFAKGGTDCPICRTVIVVVEPPNPAPRPHRLHIRQRRARFCTIFTLQFMAIFLGMLDLRADLLLFCIITMFASVSNHRMFNALYMIATLLWCQNIFISTFICVHQKTTNVHKIIFSVSLVGYESVMLLLLRHTQNHLENENR